MSNLMEYNFFKETKEAFYQNIGGADYRLPYKVWLLFVLENWMQVYGA